MKEETLIEEIEMPNDVQITSESGRIGVKGPKGEIKRSFVNPRIKLETKDNKMIITAKKATKREKKMVGTYKAHIKNMIKGATEGHKYVLKICASHFPMNVSVVGSEVVVKNFLGEKYPRKLRIKEGVSVKVQGADVIVEGANKEEVAQQAASIEQLTRITNKDRRIFQDGIWMVNKDGKEIK